MIVMISIRIILVPDVLSSNNGKPRRTFLIKKNNGLSVLAIIDFERDERFKKTQETRVP